MSCVLFGELKWTVAEAEEGWQESSVGNDVPAEGESDILVCTKSIAIIPEVIFGIHILKIEYSVVATENDFVPENNLKVEWGVYGLKMGFISYQDSMNVP